MQNNFETFFDSLDDFFFIIGADGFVRYANSKVYNVLGYTFEELKILTAEQLHPSDQQHEVETTFAAILEGKAEYCPIPLITKDGALIPVETRIIKGVWKNESAMLAISKEISKIALFDEKFLHSFHLNPLACSICDFETNEYLEVNSTFCFLFGLSQSEILGNTPIDLGLFSPKVLKHINEKIADDGKIVDFEALGYTKKGDAKTLVINSEVIQINIKKYRFSIFQDITTSRKAELSLMQFKTAVECLNASIVITDTRGIVEYTNPYFTEITGYTPEEIMGKDLRILKTDYHSPEFYSKLWATIKNGDRWEGEFFNRRKNKEYYWESAIISPVFNSEKEITHFVAVKNEITETKRMIRDLELAKIQSEKNEENYLKIIQTQSVAIAIHIQGILVFVNERAAKIFGTVDSNELLGKNVMNFVHPDDQELVATRIRESQLKNISLEAVEEKLVNNKGDIVYTLVTTTPIIFEGQQSTMIVIVDITQQKIIEFRLDAEKNKAELSNNQLQLITDSLPINIAQIDRNERYVFVNKAYHLLFGKAPQEFIGKKIAEIINERAYSIAQPYIACALRGESVTYENILIDLEGNDLYYEITYIPEFSKDREIVGFFLFGQNITARKSAEKRLDETTEKVIKAERQFRNLFENLEQGFALHQIIYDENNIPCNYKYQLVNKAFRKLTGIGDLDIINKTVLDVFPNTENHWIETFGKVCTSGNPIHYENFSKEFGKYYEVVAYSPQPNHFAVIINDVTENRKIQNDIQIAKTKAENNERRFRSIIENTQIGYFFIDNNGFFQEVNNAWLKLHKYEAIDEIMGTHFSATLTEGNLHKVEEFVNGIRESNQLYFEGEIKRLCKDGTIGDQLYSANPVYVDDEIKGIEGFIIDISSLKKSEFALIQAKKHAEELVVKLRKQKNEIANNNKRLESLLLVSQKQTDNLKELLDTALDGAIDLTDSKLGYIYFYSEDDETFTLHTWSQAAMEECKVQMPKTFYKLEHTGVWGEAVRQRKPIIVNDFTANNHYIKGTPEGHVAMKNFLTIPVFEENRITAVVGVANKNTDYNSSDINQLSLLMEIVWRNAERMRLIENLRVAKNKAEESERLKSAFMQNISHEIRTPMNSIVGFSKMLERDELLPEKRRNFIKIINNSTSQLLNIVTDILTISSLETRQETANIQPVLINDMMVNLLTSFNMLAGGKNIQIFLKKSLSDSQSEIFTDKTKVNQILTNFLNNALKFTSVGYIEFGYVLEEAPLPNSKELLMVFYVKDTGIGISSEWQEKIFDRFVQVDMGKSRKFEGNGIGLSIAKGFAVLLDGRVWVESKQDIGSTFYLAIPYKPLLVADGETNRRENSKQVLVAEDEEFNYLLIEEILKELDLQIIHAKDGYSAIEHCRVNPTIALVLMDIKMPHLDGYSAAKKIREFRPALPIVAQSAFALESEMDQYKDVFNDYITKPIDENVLISTVKKYLNT